MLPILYAFGKRIFKDSNYALVLTTLFAFDFMHFTQTRIATIDVYSVFFILLMYYYMYQYITMNFFVDGFRKTLKPLALSGLFFGSAQRVNGRASMPAAGSPCC
jgi:dolichyl-phosphate-mannose--protein O-mannosyl transferase